MKKILLLLVLCLNISIVLGQEYKAWEKHDIEGIYIMAKSKDEAKNYNNVLREGADYYIPTEQEDQVLFIRVSKRITPKLYKLKDGEMYILFSFPPFLFDSDEGMMEIKGNKGIFYKKPALNCCAWVTMATNNRMSESVIFFIVYHLSYT